MFWRIYEIMERAYKKQVMPITILSFLFGDAITNKPHKLNTCEVKKICTGMCTELYARLLESCPYFRPNW